MSATDLGSTPQPFDTELKLVLPGRRTPAGAAWEWIVAGWRLFAKAPLMWIISLVILFVVAIAMSIIPIVGSLAFQVLQAVIAGGFFAACRSLEKGGEFEMEHLLAGFRHRFVPLLIVGVVFVVGWVLIMLVFAGFVGFSVVAAMFAGNAENVTSAVMASGFSLLLGTLVMLALMVPLLAAYWFAPALVMLHDVPPVAAMKESFFACFRNFIPFLVYGVIMGFFLLLATIPFGLGLLVWVPVAITSTYAAYRSIFTEPDAPVAGAVTL